LGFVPQPNLRVTGWRRLDRAALPRSLTFNDCPGQSRRTQIRLRQRITQCRRHSRRQL